MVIESPIHLVTSSRLTPDIDHGGKNPGTYGPTGHATQPAKTSLNSGLMRAMAQNTIDDQKMIDIACQKWWKIPYL